MDKIKNISRRGSILLVAVAFFTSWAGTIQFVAFADAFFNSEFAHRILLLSSSSPGWSYTDGAGNPTYAQPGSGPNGQKTAEQFNITSNSSGTIKAITFQYCTSAAGNCKAPGNDGYATGSPGTGDTGYTADDSTDACTSSCGSRNADDVGTQKSDLGVTFSSASEATGAGILAATCDGTALINNTDGQMCQQPSATATGDNYMVLTYNGSAWVQSTGWSAASSNVETNINDSGTGGAGVAGVADITKGDATGRQNFITLTKSAGESIGANVPVEVVFFATNSNYITNPGANSFFVRMADYTDTGATDIVDGGVTVANVMTESIQITTKVLETMTFSVGVSDPDTDNSYAGGYGGCTPLSTTNPAFPTISNGIALGDQTQEYSLSTNKAYDAYSLWRVSTNSAYGGTVYYSGDTLRSTEGTTIAPLATESHSTPGTNQFGLGLVDTNTGANAMTITDGSTPTVTYPTVGQTYYNDNPLAANFLAAWHTSQGTSDPWGSPDSLNGMTPATGYGGAAGALVGTAQFDFNGSANTVPVPIASENSDVIKCATGQVRYVANIAGYTAAGIYTTKVNFLAAPQY